MKVVKATLEVLFNWFWVGVFIFWIFGTLLDPDRFTVPSLVLGMVFLFITQIYDRVSEK